MAYAVNGEKVKKAARNSIPLGVKVSKLTHDTEQYLEEILSVFLSEIGQSELKDRLSYCMRELAVNAQKANTKRVFFKHKNLDINNEKDYSTGMENFKSETLSNIEFYFSKMKEEGLYIKIVFHSKEKTFTMSVCNNVEISVKEQMRVYDRIARARAFNSMEEALSMVIDNSEGAGLGIVILVLMCKKMGLDEDAFDIDTEGGETVAKITIPFSEIHLENLDSLSRGIVEEINELPQFPDNIVYLEKLINDPDSEITHIAKQISTDPALTADLLKSVNSAQFMLPKRVDNIVEAVKIIGLRGLKNRLFSTGTKRLLKSKQKWLWDHSHKTAFYAYNLARNFKRKQDILDDAYVGGILHDIGKIIFSNIHPMLLERINGFCKERNIKRDFIEDLSAGLNHASIGGLIAEKWNFPEPLIQAIKYHHLPWDCKPEYRSVVLSVYLADALCKIETGDLVYEQLDPEALHEFGITSREQLETVSRRLVEAFSKEVS